MAKLTSNPFYKAGAADKKAGKEKAEQPSREADALYSRGFQAAQGPGVFREDKRKAPPGAPAGRVRAPLNNADGSKVYVLNKNIDCYADSLRKFKGED